MRKKIISKTIELINEISEDEEAFKTFSENFSKNIKLGVYEEEKSRDKLAKFLRYYTNKSDNLKSLDDYISDMKENQKNIYIHGVHSTTSKWTQ